MGDKPAGEGGVSGGETKADACGKQKGQEQPPPPRDGPTNGENTDRELYETMYQLRIQLQDRDSQTIYTVQNFEFHLFGYCRQIYQNQPGKL